MASFRKIQEKHQISLMNTSVFDEDPGYGEFKGLEREFVLQDCMHNLYEPIRQDALKYFRDNRISWWNGAHPTAHTLSSQIACLNHLFAIRKNKEAVLALLNGVRDEFEDVLPVPCDAEPAYIAFEVVSDKDHLNENKPTRGTQCTSVDVFIYAVHRGDKERWLIPIEWKYVEQYYTDDKSDDDKGKVRLARYTELINSSAQLKTLPTYSASVYFQEPFYQLMRQTLWAENMILHSAVESIKAVDYLHIHVIPKYNAQLLYRRYTVSQKRMEETWRSMIFDQTKYVIVDPADLMQPLENLCPELLRYLRLRYNYR